MKHRALAILEQLIAIQSVNPHYGDGAAGEAEVARYIERLCERAGLSVMRQPVIEGRDNVIVRLNTPRPGPLLMLEAHMDTVSLGSMQTPLVPVYRDGRLYGRGACDTKGSLAAMLAAMETFAREPEALGCDVALCATVDEEHAFRGPLKLLELGLPVAAAVVGEPTGLRIVAAHKGCARFAVHVRGKAAHSSVPHEGVNAIVRMAKVIGFLEDTIAPELASVRDELCGPATLSIGTIAGGKQINIVPERCTIEVDRRIVSGENPGEVLAALERRLAAWGGEHGVKLEVEPLLLDWALGTPQDDPIVRAASDTARRLALPADVCGETYGSNASKYQGIGGIPSIVYGPGSIAQAHSREEWVSVAEVEAAAAFYMELAREYRG
ncbi:M20 family metallopeptidase [Cohnella rhizosphaerae]|uniref:ArgE/DapE family deacylase n=1 Tax=Cohnella rhizosphaerae TaxID=1457232 RepID=A0A9X4L1L7_9BACL|nr:ArgE/DapE family deacylase [Cohnella rhizosphaerae]MDG0814553.1 ArgE/DapE family deacylase [Cohnella rhizosphaerae]